MARNNAYIFVCVFIWAITIPICKLYFQEILFKTWLKAESVAEMTRTLEPTWYGPEIERASTLYPLPEFLEIALNRHLVEINKIVLETVPFSGKEAIRAYLLKWDIHNIELILSSKFIGRTITETEPFLVSQQKFPRGNICRKYFA